MTNRRTCVSDTDAEGVDKDTDAEGVNKDADAEGVDDEDIDTKVACDSFAIVDHVFQILPALFKFHTASHARLFDVAERLQSFTNQIRLFIIEVELLLLRIIALV